MTADKEIAKAILVRANPEVGGAIVAAGLLKRLADAIHAALPEGTQGRTTTAVARVVSADATSTLLVGSSEQRLRPAQRDVARMLGLTPVAGPGHAEQTVINAARAMGGTVQGVAASRPICDACADAIRVVGAIAESALKNP